MADYYEILRILPTATQAQVGAAYRALAKDFHPDTNHSSDAEARFKEIDEAYHCLSDPQRRAQYDAQFGRKTAGRQAATATSRSAGQPPRRPPSPGEEHLRYVWRPSNDIPSDTGPSQHRLNGLKLFIVLFLVTLPFGIDAFTFGKIFFAVYAVYMIVQAIRSHRTSEALAVFFLMVVILAALIGAAVAQGPSADAPPPLGSWSPFPSSVANTIPNTALATPQTLTRTATVTASAAVIPVPQPLQTAFPAPTLLALPSPTPISTPTPLPPATPTPTPAPTISSLDCWVSTTGLNVACSANIASETYAAHTVYSWTASAGSPSSGSSTGGHSPQFQTTLSAPGSMTITLRACNGVACATKSTTLNVSETPPTIQTLDCSVVSGRTILCSAYLGRGAYSPSTVYSWVASAGSPSSGSSTGGYAPDFVTTLGAPGSTTITLRACNGAACATGSKTVTVQ